MPGEVKKPLYIGTSLEELNKRVDVNFSKSQSSKIGAKTANKVFAEAEKAFKSLDEERAYVLFMKYIALWQAIRKSRDYKENKDFVDALLGDDGCRKALKKAEELSVSLNLRYGELEEAKEASRKLEEEKKRAKTNGVKDRKTKEGEETPTNNGETEEEPAEMKRVLGKDGVVNSIELYKEFLCSPDSVLVMDIRRSDHFKDSHMTMGQCMSIPAEILKPGLTALTLEMGLADEAKAMWRRRTEVEFIVLVDWDQSQGPESSLAIVKATMCKWDWGTTYRNEPIVLNGGYEDWLLKYPMYTNNPHAKKPAKKAEQSKDLLDFEYPDFDDDKPPPPLLPPSQVAPAPAEQQRPTQNGNGVYQNRMFYISGQPNNQPSAPRPPVDRSVKPVNAKPEPSAPNYAQNNTVRDSAKSTPASGRNSADPVSSAKPARAPEPAQNGPTSSTTKMPPSFPAVNRNLKPNLESSAASSSAKSVSSRNTDSGSMPVNAPRVEPAEDSDAGAKQAVKETSEEADKKSDAQLEELKRKEEQARQDLNKMRYDKTKAENEKLKEEKLEMEKNLLKLQQELTEAKARQEQRRRTPVKTTSPAHSSSGTANQGDSTDSVSSSGDGVKKSTIVTPEPTTQVSASKPKDPSGGPSKAQPNQNSNAATADVKSAGKASSGAAKPSATPTAAAAAAAAAGAPAKAGTLPKGWEKRWDEKSNRYFYIDHYTGSTRWEPPGDAVQRPRAPEAKGAGTSASSTAAATATSKPRGDLSSSRPSTGISSQVTRKPLMSESAEPSSKSPGLKRSFSSPNIAQMVMNEGEAAVSMPFPAVDRSTKPPERVPQQITQFKSTNQSRVRQLNPIFGNQGRALTGLRNLGNTCFMNSVIQCLHNTTPLAKYFIIDKYLMDINRENPLGRGGEVAEEFAVVIKAVWSGQYRSIAPRDLRDTVTKYVPEFRKHVGHHHDSQEFLLFLLDGLHEDLNEVKKREYIKEEDFSKYPDDKAARASWDNHEKLNRSIIVKLFQGQFKSTVECLTCHNKSVKFEAFMYLSLPITSNSKCSLHDCLMKFSQPEKLSGDNATHCSHCKTNRNSKKTILIWKLPKILLIHLKRFYYEGMWRQKLQTFVDFPNDLSMDRYVIGPAKKDAYQLYGVSNHTGTLDGGHYTACCKNAVNRRWYKYDDHEVYDASNSNIKSSAAYILFYTSLAQVPP